MLINHLHSTKQKCTWYDREWNKQVATSATEKREKSEVNWCSYSCLGGTYTNIHGWIFMFCQLSRAGAWEKGGCVVASLVSNYITAALRYISSDVDASVHARDFILLVCTDVRQWRQCTWLLAEQSKAGMFHAACLLLFKLQQDALLQFFMLLSIIYFLPFVQKQELWCKIA